MTKEQEECHEDNAHEFMATSEMKEKCNSNDTELYTMGKCSECGIKMKESASVHEWDIEVIE